jgi:hypothetical protein
LLGALFMEGVRMRQVILAAIVILVMVAHTHAEELSDEEASRIRNEIQSEVQNIVAAANALDSNNVVANFSPSPDSRYVARGTVYSRETFTAELRKSFNNLQSQEILQNINLINQHVVALAPDLAIHTTQGSLTLTAKSKKTVVRFPWALTSLWRRESGIWRLFNLHQSADLLAVQKEH